MRRKSADKFKKRQFEKAARVSYLVYPYVKCISGVFFAINNANNENINADKCMISWIPVIVRSISSLSNPTTTRNTINPNKTAMRFPNVLDS